MPKTSRKTRTADEIAEMAGRVRADLKELSTNLRGGGDVFRKGLSPKKAKKSH